MGDDLRQIDLDFVRAMSRLEEKVDAINAKLEKMESLDKRVSTLEKVRTYNAGWMAGAVAIASVIGGVLAEIFRRCFGI